MAPLSTAADTAAAGGSAKSQGGALPERSEAESFLSVSEQRAKKRLI